MAEKSTSELILIRHGPTDRPDTLCGRTDVGLSVPVPPLKTGSALASVDTIRISPAIRARATARGLWPDSVFHEDARLWEQDFGEWEGVAFTDLPDVGELSSDALADLAGPGGESFREVVDRVRPALAEAANEAQSVGRVALVAHAGVIRAALAIALNNAPAALAFEIDHISVTRLRCLRGGAYAIKSVNGALS